MYVPMLPASGVYDIFMHSNLRSVKHTRLIHIVPCEYMFISARVLIVVKLSRPPFSHILTCKIRIGGRSYKIKLCKHVNMVQLQNKIMDPIPTWKGKQ